MALRPITSRCPEPFGLDTSNAFAFGMLIGQKEGLDQFSFAACDHSRKPLEPLSIRNLWCAIKPRSEQHKLVRGDSAILYPVQQMLEQRRREACAPYLGHGSDSVESPGQTFFEFRCFRRIRTFCQLPSQ